MDIPDGYEPGTQVITPATFLQEPMAAGGVGVGRPANGSGVWPAPWTSCGGELPGVNGSGTRIPPQSGGPPLHVSASSTSPAEILGCPEATSESQEPPLLAFEMTAPPFVTLRLTGCPPPPVPSMPEMPLQAGLSAITPTPTEFSTRRAVARRHTWLPVWPITDENTLIELWQICTLMRSAGGIGEPGSTYGVVTVTVAPPTW